MESNYEQMVNKAKAEGGYRTMDSPEDLVIMDRMNKIGIEIKEESNRKQIASEIECSKIYLY